MPILYRYDENTKEYIGSLPACEDPMASMRLGKSVYAILENSTLKEPIFEEGKVPVFNGEDWELLEDNRGKVVYKKTTGEPLVIQELGGIPKGYAEEKPITLQDLKFEKIDLIKAEFLKEISKKVEVKGLEVTVSDRGKFNRILENSGEENLICMENEETSESEFYEKEDIEYISKYLYLREMLLACRKNSLIKELVALTTKKSVNSFKIDFNITGLIAIKASKSREDIDIYIKNLIGESK